MPFTFAGEFADTVIDSSGKPVRSTAITVKRAADGVTATLYTDRTKADEAANPVSSDSYGNLRFYADPGSYLLVAAGGPAGGVNIVVGVDPAEAVEDGGAAPSGAAGGSLAGTYPNPTLAAGAVGTAALADGAVTVAKLSFDPATQVELTAETVARLEGDEGHVQQDLLLAKGDLIVGAGAGVAARLPAGTNGLPLVADSTETLGVEFAQLGTAGIANGAVTAAKVGADVATLGVDGKLPAAQLPDLAISAFLGTSASQAAMLALVGQRGDWTVRTDTDPDSTWMLVTDDPTQIGNWRQLSVVTDAVASVNGRTGAVVGLAEQTDLTAEVVARAAAVTAEATARASADALLAPLASPTFTGTLVVPAASVTGKNGLSTRTFAGRKTTAGAPTTGTWAVDDEVIDSAGVIWRCTIAGTPGTWASQSATYGAPVSLSSLPTPCYFSHRLGGMFAPEGTMEGARVAVAGGADGLEMDCQPLGDGVLGIMHDTTVDRTTDGTGNVSDFTAPAWRALNAAAKFLWNGKTVPPALLTEVLSEFGGRKVLMIEPKDSSNAAQIMDLCAALYISGSVVIATSSLTVLQAVKARGFACYFFWLGALTGTTPAAAVAAGADYLGLDGVARPDADVTTLVATGKPVWPFTIDRRSRRDELLALGATGFVSDQVVYLKGTTAQRKVDSWRQGVLGHGFRTQSTAGGGPPAVSISSGKLTFDSATAVMAYLVGEVGPIANAAGTYAIDIDYIFNTLPAAGSAHISMVFGAPDDRRHNNSSGSYGRGYNIQVRKDGIMGLYRYDSDSTFTLLGGGTVATTAPTAGQVMHLTVNVTPTSITCTRTDSGGFTPIVAADATWRGGYLHVGKNAEASYAAVKALTITP